MSVTDAVQQALLALTEILTPLGVLALAVFLLFYVGVVLPAVWSHHEYRRSAARRVLGLLLHNAHQAFRGLRRMLPF
ncbi:hypothetical protein [Streptomyces pini]|uniref:Uncharacterized protein n=1 Tax=Streptomyces pini TaxID=1520580 RepID=A0A1I4JN94_9ACTN|nr:hypothetical protein [Streptomyces pini]SFL67761.1 hypothetical protein SAMN05192584_12420 [Streptomyces pini]